MMASSRQPAALRRAVRIGSLAAAATGLIWGCGDSNRHTEQAAAAGTGGKPAGSSTAAGPTGSGGTGGAGGSVASGGTAGSGGSGGTVAAGGSGGFGGGGGADPVPVVCDGGGAGEGGEAGAGFEPDTTRDIPIEEACPSLVEDCGTSNLQSHSKQINILIVLDKSGSMDITADGQRKWDAMKDALSTAFGSPSAQNIGFGLALYPFPEAGNAPIDLSNCGADGNCCEMPTSRAPNVPVAPGAATVDEIMAQLDATEPGGGTPTAVALEHALQYFACAPDDSLSGEKYVLLVTDGGPNCNESLSCDAETCSANLEGQSCDGGGADGNCCDESYVGGSGCVDDASVVNAIQDLQSWGIDTVVVGLPGSEAYETYLNEFAEAGGQPVPDAAFSYYRVDDTRELGATLEQTFSERASSCRVQLDTAPDAQPTVAIDCQIVPSTDGSTRNWAWNGKRRIEFLGEICHQVQQGVGRVDTLFNCPGSN